MNFPVDNLKKHEKIECLSRERLIWMDVDHFLSLCPSGHSDEKLENCVRVLASGKSFRDIPRLWFERKNVHLARVWGHEGRHRARALKLYGYKKIPVIICGDIRWSEQLDRKNRDYVRNWPIYLEGENGWMMHFPVKRKNACL